MTLWTPENGMVNYFLRQAMPKLPSCRLVQGALDAEEREQDIVRKTQMSCCVQLDCHSVICQRFGPLPRTKTGAHAHGLSPVAAIFPVEVE